MIQYRLSHHILPNASTMLGVCMTGVGLVKIAEAHMGPSHVDEYLALNSFLFLASCICSYIAIRHSGPDRRVADRFEWVADICFMIGLLVLTLISFLFAYEFV